MGDFNSKKTLAPLLYFIRPYPWYILWIVLLIFISSILEGVNVVVILGLLNTVLAGNTGGLDVSGSRLVAYSMKALSILPFENKIMSVVIIAVFIIGLKCLFDFFRRYFTCFVSAKIWHDVQYKVFTKCLYSDYQFFLDNKEGEIIYRCFNAPSFMGVTLQYSCEFLAEIVKLVVILSILFALSFQFSIGILLFTTIFFFLTKVIAKNITYKIGKARQDFSIQQTIILAELINGIKHIKIFLSENRWLNEYDKAMRNYFKLYVKDETWQALPPNILELLAVTLLGVSLMLIKGIKSEFSVSHLSIVGVFVYSFYRFMPSLKNLSAKGISYAGNLAIIQGLHEFCEARLKNIPDGDRKLLAFSDGIVFRNVSFDYPGKKHVLNSVNIKIKKGTTTAIVGKSGSGKTTMVNLILRLFVPGSGQVLIDGQDLSSLKLSSWYDRIGYVSQDIFIFNASIKDNIVFGRSFNEEKLLKVSELANAHEFIAELPDRYETFVGDKGMKLSGGQRQRIAIARAMYNDPEMLIFDEATSSLDNYSETLIQNSLKRISSKHTVLLIAHRLSTVINSDHIIVLKNGDIAEEGNHAGLIERGKEYWRLYNSDLTKEKVT